MLARKWQRVGQMQLVSPRLRRFQRSRWSYWEPWVDLRLHQEGLTGEMRVRSKALFRWRHQEIVGHLYRLCIPADQIREWRLDNPLMVEDARVLMVRRSLFER
jgi:hypothetical protein